MDLLLSNTLTKRKEPFVPLGKIVGLYTCGPTVYNYIHIGNLRSFIFEDVLKRVLLFNGYKVNHIMNITDVGHLVSDADDGDDKMTKGLQREGLPISLEGMKKLATKYSEAFVDDIKAMHILLPNKLPKATEHIEEQITFIKKLEEKGFTYKTSDGVYFNTKKDSNYGQLVALQDSEVKARIINNKEKKDDKDFALWKFNEMGWKAPWGEGFPGWHIECSAMATKYLGEQFDIHCGGQDLAPIHHTNEIAQSECAFGKKPWVKYWLHNEFVVLQKGEKMSKSTGNFLTLKSITSKGFHPLDYRYFCLGTHYKKPLMFSWEALESAKIARKKLFTKVLELKGSPEKEQKELQQKYLQRFTEDVNDDLNTPKALATMWELLKDETLTSHDKYYLLLQFDKIFGFNLGNLTKEKIPESVIALAEERLIARNEKQWEKADVLREKIEHLGYTIADVVDGYELQEK